MAQSTGFILAAGTVTAVNRYVFNGKPIDAYAWKLLTATGLTAIIFAGAESFAGPQIPKGLAMIALLTVFLVNPASDGVPSPAVSALNWFNGGK